MAMMINIRVCYASSNHFNLLLPSHSTFRDVKSLIAQQTGLEPKRQRLFFRGKVKEDEEYLHTAGVKNNAKILLVECQPINEVQTEETNIVGQYSGSPANTDINTEVSQFSEELDSKDSKERKDEDSKRPSKGCAQVAEIRREVDELAEQLAALEPVIDSGTKVEEKQFIVLAELLMRQLLKLDTIEAEGEGRVQRKLEVHRVQNLVDKVDSLKMVNSNLFSN